MFQISSLPAAISQKFYISNLKQREQDWWNCCSNLKKTSRQGWKKYCSQNSNKPATKPDEIWCFKTQTDQQPSLMKFDVPKYIQSRSHVWNNLMFWNSNKPKATSNTNYVSKHKETVAKSDKIWRIKLKLSSSQVWKIWCLNTQQPSLMLNSCSETQTNQQSSLINFDVSELKQTSNQVWRNIIFLKLKKINSQEWWNLLVQNSFTN